MEYIKKLSVKEFDDYAKNHQCNNIFQCSSWAKTKSNWKPLYVGIKENKVLKGASLILLRKLPLNFYFAYMPRGPLIDFNNKKHTQFFFNNLKKHLRKENILLCKFDPNITIDELDFKDKDIVKDLKDDSFISNLNKLGIDHVGYTLSLKETIQPRIQLELETDDYENIIPKKTMKKIRNSFNKDVVIVNEYNNVDSLAKMIEFTKSRHNINLRNKEYFKLLLDSFKEDACVLSAYIENKLISSCLLVKCKNATEILYSGYDDKYRRYNSTYPLRYEAIKWAKDNGCKYFNFGGVEGTFDDGLTMFKSSFNPKINVYIGEFNLNTYPLLSNVANMLYKRIKNKD